uniref:Uncharacterized protein n=1 Tax=Avena sativa TaxID=4498 RepID=A0ACD5XE47_AVESA
MQGVVIRRARCPAKLYRRHIPSSCPAAARVSRSLRYRVGGVERCSAAAAGERARSVAVRATGGPGTGDDDEQAAPPPRQDVVVDAGGGASSGGAKRGTVAGAVALIVGTSIGSGILAVPQSTAPAGFVPSAVCMVTCWAFLVTEALLLAEINVHLRRKQKKDGDGNGGGGALEVISLKSMAQETLGEWGGNLAATAYLFLSYTSMVAYTSKSGEVLSRVIGSVPEPVSGGAFTAAVALLIAGGGTGVTAQVNQLLTFFMIGLLLTIEVSAVALGGGLGLPANTHWEQVPATLPVIIFTLVYHDIAPVICAYLEGDLARIRLSILVGSLVPLLSLLVWDDIALGLSTTTDLDRFNILDMLKTEWGYTVVETFSLLAVGTSLIGTLLGASQFFVEQMTNLAASPAEEKVTGDGFEEDGSSRLGWETLLESNRLGYVATGVVVVPTMLIAAAVPDSFSIATDIAGGYCMTILYGVLPPLMAWSIGSKLSDPKAGFVEAVETSSDVKEKASFTSAKPVLLGMGVFSVLMVFQQIFQDFVSFNTYLLSWAS